MSPRESAVLKECLLAVPDVWPGARAFRNNVGLALYPGGHRVPYGLCAGSSDIIGWRPVTVDERLLGATVAQFVAIECKARGRKPTPEQAQFLDTVTNAGGLAVVAYGRADVERALGGVTL